MGEMGAEGLPWGWAAGRAKHLLCSTNLQSPGSQGRDGVQKT